MAENREIFITGATGFLGAKLRQRLFKEGFDTETNLRYLHTKKYLAVIHLAAVTHTKTEFDPALIEANFILTNEIFKHPSRIIYASSCSAMYDTCPYAQSKLYAEHLANKHGNALGFRFFNLFGLNNNKGIVKALMDTPSGSQFLVRGPELIRDYVYVEDAIEQIMMAIYPHPIKINMDAIIKEKVGTPEFAAQWQKVMDATRIELVNHDEYKSSSLRFLPGIVNIGTGIGTTTMQLVNKYMEVSGKHFKIVTAPAGEHEPLAMVSNNPVCKTSLEDGLKLLINETQK